MNKKITLFLICTFFTHCILGKELNPRQERILEDLLAKKHLRSEKIDQDANEQEKMVRKDLLLMRAEVGEKALQCVQSIRENQNATLDNAYSPEYYNALKNEYKNAYWTEYYDALDSIFDLTSYSNSNDPESWYSDMHTYFGYFGDHNWLDEEFYPEFPMFLNPARRAKNSVLHLVDKLRDKYGTTELVKNMHAHWDN